MMAIFTGNGPAPNCKRSGADEGLRTIKRTRTSLADQDSPSNEPPSLRGGGRGSFTPAAGTWKKPTAEDSTQNRLFRNQGRVPVNAALGIRPPTSSPARTPATKRPTRGTSGRRGQTSTGTQTGPAGLTPGESTEGEGDRDANSSRKNQHKTPTPGRRLSMIIELPSPNASSEVGMEAGLDDIDETPDQGLGAEKDNIVEASGVAPDEVGPDTNWEYPDLRWNTDRQIIEAWKDLERLIARYVSDVIVDSIPDIEAKHYVFPYEAFARLSDLAIPMVRNERYAKYIFQLSLWNLLSEKFLSHMATEWACEEKGKHPWGLRTKGLAAAMDLLTHEQSIDPKSTIPRHDREKWYIWRKDTVDVAYGWLSQHTDYEQTVDNAVFDVLTLYQGHIKPAFAGGDQKSWDNLVGRTTELVTFAARLSIMMRRSQDGTWSPFIPIRGQVVRSEAMMRHQDTELSLPPGQTETKIDSTITATVVPGLSKYEMTDVETDPAHPGEKNTIIRKMVRMKAKCLIDITEAQTGSLRDGDIWIADDI